MKKEFSHWIASSYDNMFSPAGIIGFKAIDPSTGELVNDNNYSTSQIFATWEEYASDFFVSRCKVIAFYDENEDFITAFTDVEDGRHFHVEGAYYGRVTLYLQDEYAVGDFIFSPAREANPIYSSDLSIDEEAEQSEMFMRKSLSGSLTFTGGDYSFIMGRPNGWRYYYVLEDLMGFGINFCGRFTKVDIEIDEDHSSIKVKPEVLDKYTSLLDKSDKEYEQMDFPLKSERLLYNKRPCLQVYMQGGDKVACFTGYMYWEQDATKVDNLEDLVNLYCFEEVAVWQELVVDGGDDMSFNGSYYGTFSWMYDRGTTKRYTSSNGCRIDVYSDTGAASPLEFTLYNSQGTAVARGELQKQGDDPMQWASGQEVNLQRIDGTAQYKMTAYPRNLWARMISDVPNGTTEEEIHRETLPDVDITDNNNNYRYGFGINIDGLIVVSDTKTDEPTGYGLAEDGMYFSPPPASTGSIFAPVLKDTWINLSLWLNMTMWNDSLYVVDVPFWKGVVLNDAYSLATVIKGLLLKMHTGFEFNESSDYSQFLYGNENMVSGEKTPGIYITPKTNIKVSGYNEEARNAVFSFNAIMGVLKSSMNLYWYIEGNKLRIEHLSFFENGKSYVSPVYNTTDLTLVNNSRNGKPWAWIRNKFKFDKEELPEKYTYSWMDETGDAFDGYPIEINSPDVNAGQEEEISITDFTSNVDYVLLNPDNVSDDGFMILATGESELMHGATDGTDPSQTAHTVNGTAEPILEVRISTDMYKGGAGTFNLIVHVSGNMQASDGVSGKLLLETGSNIGDLDALRREYDIPNGQFDGDFVVPANVGVPLLFIRAGHYTYDENDTIRQLYVRSVTMQGISLSQVVMSNVHLAAGYDALLQNGWLSFQSLQPKFLTYGMPASDITVNGVRTGAKSTKRARTQEEVGVPANVEAGNAIITHSKNGVKEWGVIKTKSVNLTSKYTTATLSYDTNI